MYRDRDQVRQRHSARASLRRTEQQSRRDRAPWSTVASVLTLTNDGFLAGVHSFACAQPGCSTTSGAAITGFAVNSVAPPLAVPEPATIMIFGAALAGFGVVRRRFIA